MMLLNTCWRASKPDACPVPDRSLADDGVHQQLTPVVPPHWTPAAARGAGITLLSTLACTEVGGDDAAAPPHPRGPDRVARVVPLTTALPAAERGPPPNVAPMDVFSVIALSTTSAAESPPA